jgi:hypothetical protein
MTDAKTPPLFPKLSFRVENDKLIVDNLPAHLHLRGIGYTSKALAELKHVSIASANIGLAKVYMDSVKDAGSNVDPFLFDAALLSTVVKYGSVFKVDGRGRSIDPTKIFTPAVVIVNKFKSPNPIVIRGKQKEFLDTHERIMKIRDQFVAHDDRLIGNTECFAAFDDQFNCEHVITLTQRSTVFSVLKTDLNRFAMCVDAVFTWLALEKERRSQQVNDEINRLKERTRKRFPEPVFENFRGLLDRADRKSKKEQHWEFDWNTGKKIRVGDDEEQSSH